MPSAIFAGINRNTISRLKVSLKTLGEDWSHWNFTFAPCDRNEGLSEKMVDMVLRAAEAKQGAHIFGMSATDRRGRDRPALASCLREAFRFRWMPDDLAVVMHGPPQPFQDLMAEILLDEDYWRQHLMPASCHGPLVLPSNFSAHHSVEDLWRLSESYNNRGMLERAVRLLPQFKERHRVTKGNAKAWRDTHNLLWDDYGAHHGSPQFPHGWKYSYELAAKFHFDLTNEHEAKFNYLSPDGRNHPGKADGHLNVNAHGFVC